MTTGPAGAVVSGVYATDREGLRVGLRTICNDMSGNFKGHSTGRLCSGETHGTNNDSPEASLDVFVLVFVFGFGGLLGWAALSH